MGFGHEKLDVCRAAIEYVGRAYGFCESLNGHRNAKDQLLRASQAIPLNIAGGNGKATDGDRRRYLEIARGSALECGAVQDVLQVCGALSSEENATRKALLDRIVAMLTKLGQRGYAVHEYRAEYTGQNDPDSDSDPDTEGNKTKSVYIKQSQITKVKAMIHSYRKLKIAINRLVDLNVKLFKIENKNTQQKIT